MSRAGPSRFGGGLPKYSSKVCRRCGGDYLYPVYGGWANCNGCRFPDEDNTLHTNL